MGEMLRFTQSNKKLELRISATQNFPKSRLLGPFAKKSSKKTLKCVTSLKVSLVATNGVGDIGVFFLTSALLEIVRRFSSAHCPLIWHGLQAAQILCCPPFKWIQKWVPFTGFVKAMQTLSRPLMFLSLATCFLSESDTSKGTLSGSGADLTELSSQLASQNPRHFNKVSRSVDTEDWLMELYQELEKENITIPERLNEDELHRFHDVSDGDIAKCLSLVKKTIQWRKEYTLLSPQQLESWGNLVFWHGSDMMQRPTLIIRLGLAGSHLGSNGQAQFVKAVVSQVEYGVLNLLDVEHTQLTVVMDCHGLSPFGFPLQTFRSCAMLLQDHYPNRLGCLLVVRLSSIARVITQTLFQVLKPRTQQKLTIVGEDYQEVLSRYFEELPTFLGGRCSCSKCANEVENVEERIRIGHGGQRLNSSLSDFELCDSSRLESLDTDYRFILTGMVGVFLLWLCLLHILRVHDDKITFPQLYNRNSS